MDPETNKLFVELVNMPETSRILDHLDIQNEKMAAAQQQQMAMQQQQLEMQQQAALAQQQQKNQYDFQAEEHKAQLDILKKKAEQSF
jgi:hypothetical protein